MPQTYNGSINFPSNFDVQTTAPLDARFVVDSKDDLTNGSIKSPYQGLVVNIKGTSELWILKTQGIEESHDINNWELSTGSNNSNNLSKYSIPVMTPKMAEDATNDPDVDFDGSEDPYILTDYNAESLSGESNNQIITSVNGTYLDIMMRSIRALQSEVARLKNSFEYGIDSYKGEDTAKSKQLDDYRNISTDEPLWAIDPGYLSEVPDNINFNTYLDKNHTFVKLGVGDIDVSVDGQLTFNDCSGEFYDGVRNSEGEYDNFTLYNLADSKLITYLITDQPYITFNLVSLDDRIKTKTVKFKPLMQGNTLRRYGICMVISRKVDTKSSNENEKWKGFNYIYFSIINYDTDEKIYEGYLNNFDILQNKRYDIGERYSISSIRFGDNEDNEYKGMTLYRMRYYTKFEDFNDEVISSAPSEEDWKYGVSHITIRSVENKDILTKITDHLKEDELVWEKKSMTLYIKSNGKMCIIGSNKNTGDNDNNDDNMTNKEIIDALIKMGIVINVNYKKDSNGNDTDVIESVDNMSLSPISDFTFVNNDTGKKFTFTVDNEGNLIGKDKSAQTIDEFMKSIGSSAGDYDNKNYKAVRGFSSDYLYRKGGEYTTKNGVNYEKDAGKKSDRLRFSSFYAPLNTDVVHGCTHSFVELENTSDVDIPLTGVYLHFYNPAADEYKGKVYHLELDGVIKAGGTYLVRGAKHAEYDDVSSFIKVRTYDKEWYDEGKLLSFEQEVVKTETDNEGTKVADDSKIKTAYRFCLTYGLPDLNANEPLVVKNENFEIDGAVYNNKDFPWIIKNPRFIDSCSFSSFTSVAAQVGTANPWYANGPSGTGITIAPNTMFRLMFALDPAKQAYNGFNAKDSSRLRYNKATDIQILSLDKEFIGYPKSNEIIKINRFTPKASYENRNVMTDKTQLDENKPNMVTCSFGIDVYNTRCFNWISCGVFDEYVWLRKKGETKWTKYQSYTKVGADNVESTELPRRKEYSMLVNNTVYARMTDRFPGNNVLFTSHKCVVVLPDAETDQVVYEYVVGRPNKDGNPDFDHTNEIYTFILSPRTYEGRVYQITDQQGFHWIEYQVWAAAAEFLNKKIDEECNEINADSSNTKVFPILINTGDMTQSGARINEWLDYYNGGKSLFNHIEQMNCVGNNDLCDIDPHNLGTGNDTNKSNSHFFHYFYCFDLKDENRLDNVMEENKKFFNGESLVVKSHNCSVDDITTSFVDRYIPSTYYFKTKNVMYVILNSELPEAIGQKWFGLCSSNKKYVSIYTGIETNANGEYDETIHNYFTPIYESLYAWLNDNKENGNKKIVFAMHEMPFTVITATSLNKSKKGQYVYTRNYPTGTSRLGSNTNQLNVNENRGIYWCSRLLEYFGCKLVIGGHKHTYALSYPIKERYTWIHNGETFDSKDKIKPLSNTLADEAGLTPDYEIKWSISLSPGNEDTFNVEFGDNPSVDLSSTKTPYVPENLYNRYGKSAFKENGKNTVRCCSPINVVDEKYDGFVSYSMCQATGYKLKSNKELPSCVQVFSKIVPMTKNTWTSDGSSVADSPNENQVYPMYSVLEFNNDCTELDVRMMRIQGIFKVDGKDSFTQLNYGTKDMTNSYLCQNYKYTAENQTLMNAIENASNKDICYRSDENKYYMYNGSAWTEYTQMMYGKWEKTLPKEIDKHYLHIKF